jgi:hypothetical protein
MYNVLKPFFSENYLSQMKIIIFIRRNLFMCLFYIVMSNWILIQSEAVKIRLY